MIKEDKLPTSTVWAPFHLIFSTPRGTSICLDFGFQLLVKRLSCVVAGNWKRNSVFLLTSQWTSPVCERMTGSGLVLRCASSIKGSNLVVGSCNSKKGFFLCSHKKSLITPPCCQTAQFYLDVLRIVCTFKEARVTSIFFSFFCDITQHYAIWQLHIVISQPGKLFSYNSKNSFHTKYPSLLWVFFISLAVILFPRQFHSPPLSPTYLQIC